MTPRPRLDRILYLGIRPSWQFKADLLANRIYLVLLALFLQASSCPVAVSGENADASKSDAPKAIDSIRVATYNVSLYGKRAGQISDRLADQNDQQAKRIARIVQTVRPDILLVNELDFQPDGLPTKRLAENYFAVAQSTATGDRLKPVTYPFQYFAPSNTGVDSLLDLNADGKRNTPNDAWGYGVYPGQYAMTVFSRFPIATDRIRTFQKLLWKDMPDAIRPVDPSTGTSYYDDTKWNQLRLSSKNHIDVPITVNDRVIHVLASHPTPPVFDGPEDRNGARNHDEVEFWNRYIARDASKLAWLVDDQGAAGGLAPEASFVIMGDLNADPVDGSGRREAIRKLLAQKRVNDTQPSSRRDGIAQTGASAIKTADFGRNGFMRVDYVLPSSDLKTVDSGVFWPPEDSEQHDWITASDHRMVWIDVSLDQ